MAEEKKRVEDGGFSSTLRRRIDFTILLLDLFFCFLHQLSSLLLIPPNRSDNGGNWLGVFNRAWVGEEVDGAGLARHHYMILVFRSGGTGAMGL